jgi:group I intron endonuclease
MKQAFIYLTTNNVNGKKYLGSHYGKLDDGYLGSGKLFLRALNRYGAENFTREILEVVDRDSQFEREQHYLEKYNVVDDQQYYNLNPKAGGGFDYINNHTVLKKVNEERFRTLHKVYGHPKGMKGKKHPNRELADKKLAEYIDSIKRPIEKWDLYGNYVCTYKSITEAAKDVGGRPSNIKYTADGKFKKAYNYVWKWK